MRVRLGAFTVHERIGRGGMGAVYRATHPDGTPSAVKVLEPRHAVSPLAQRALLNEIRAAAGLDHPGVVALFDAGTVDAHAAAQSEGTLSTGAPWVAMELCSGGNLADNPPHSWTELLALLLALLDALGHIHARGVIHRDLKPENVLLAGPTDPRPGWRLADFGIATLADNALSEGESQGTPLYMAPEQVRGERWRIGPSTDLYSLGCMTWERACGRTHRSLTSLAAVLQAQATEPLPALVPAMAVPAGLEGWIERLTQLDAGLRFPSAAEAATALMDLGPADRGPVHSPAPHRAPARTFALSALLDPLPGLDDGRQVAAPSWAEPSRIPTWPLPADGAVGLRLGNAGLGLLPWREVPLVGRAPLQDVLWDGLRAVITDREPVLRWLRGPLGVGKSRLARWAAERAAELGVALPLRISAADGDDALGAALARHHGVSGMPREELLRVLAKRGIDADQAAALANWWTGASTAVGLRAGLGAGRIAALASRRPVVLVVDGPEQDQAIPALIRQLLDQRVRALVLLCSDDETLADHPAREALDALCGSESIVRVGPLEGTHAHALVHAALGLEPALAAQVAGVAAGRPAVALGLVRELAARDALAWTDHGFALAEGATLPSIDAQSDDRLDRLLARLDPAQATAVRAGALVGRWVRPARWSVACQAVGVAPDPDALEPLLRAALVSLEADASWAFTHPALAITARAGMSQADQSAVHRALGLTAETPVERAQHLWASSDHLAALDPMVDAAEQLVLEGRQKEAKLWTDRWAEAAARVGLAPDDPRWPRGMARTAAVERSLGQLVEARAHALAAQAHALPGSGALAFATAELGAIHGMRGDVSVARELLLLARDRFLDADMPLLAEGCTVAVATALVVGGQADRAWEMVAPMRSVSPRGEARLARTRAVIAMHQGDRELARAEFSRALEAYREAGNLHGVANAFNDLGTLDAEDGDATGALVHFQAAAAQFAALGAYQAQQAELNIALIQTAQGQPAQARARTLPILRRMERNQSGDVALPRGILLAVAAQLADWTEVDAQLHALRQEVVFAQFLSSLAEAADLAERACRDAGQLARADAIRAWFTAVEANTRSAR